jgi:hypothetical protein
MKVKATACLVALSLSAALASAQEPAGSVTPLIRQMAGTWQVQSRMWPGPGAAPVNLPPATARREVVRDAYLQEVMEPAERAAQPPFTRVAYFIFNPTHQQYEYVSLDSRLPQFMSYARPGANKMRNGRVELAGGSFVAPEWGAQKNVPFTYRLAVGPVEGVRQVVQLFLTGQSAGSKEFLAFEYVYSRQEPR